MVYLKSIAMIYAQGITENREPSWSQIWINSLSPGDVSMILNVYVPNALWA